MKLALVVMASSLNLAALGSAEASIAPIYETFHFVGTCLDCQTTAQGDASLVLENYTPGTPIQNSNFVSFTYSGDVSYLLTSESFISGRLNTQQGFYNFVIGTPGRFFATADWGAWSTGVTLSQDQGYNGVWNATVSGVPELSTWAMMIFGFAALGWVARHNARSSGLQC